MIGIAACAGARLWTRKLQAFVRNVGLIAPTMLIREPVETHVVDGVEIVFHLAPETEAPAVRASWAERFERRPVRIEPLDGQRVLISQGLIAG